MDEQVKWLYEHARLDPEFSNHFPCPPFDPAKSYEEMLELPLWPDMSQYLNYWFDNGAVRFHGDDFEKTCRNIEKGLLDIRIDFNKVNSPDKLKSKVLTMIDTFWGKFQDKHGHSVQKETKDFKLIYLVGKLREAQKTWNEIVKHPDFPQKYKEPISSAKKLNKHHRMLRQGGWKIYLK